ncbi:MAG: flippase [Pantoea sp.]|uniref:Flippase n=1 Tax=Pantoea phytobeneficialis TaxID=2052056 RepID=A0AAP9H3Y8_9GAMM|nr:MULTISPECIES: flippase [Pantoea]ERK18532.1 Membrane protein involved in the export of O-antigen, teichoic acid lipoteichoic acids [Pantoea sp. AS-PWVM4]MDO6406346.1 flippase [Pantoea phytobeneficialis]QGR06168.1 flippase [Pantoea phytobeneficialis]
MAKTLDKSLVINILSLLAYRGASFLFPLVTLPYLARILGVNQMGVLALAIACVMYCSTISDWGFNVYTTKDIAHHREDKTRVTQIFWSTFNAKLLLMLSTSGVLLLTTWLNPGWHYLFWVVLANCTTLLGSLFSFGWLMQGFEKLGKTAVIATFGNFCAIPLTFLLVKTPDDTWLAALIPGVVSMISALITLRFVLMMKVIGRYRFEPSEIKQRLKDSVHVFIAIAGANLFNSVNVVILAAFTSHYAIGIYNGADRLRKAANSVPEQIGNAFFPRVSYLFARDKAAAIAATRKSLLISFLLSLGIVIFTWFFADDVVRILLGQEFVASADVLRVFVLCFLFGNIAYPAGLQVLIPHGLARQRMLVMLGPGIINIPVCAFLAWKYGAIGAAWSMVIAEFLVCVGIFWVMARHGILREYLHNSPSTRTAIKDTASE